MNAHYIYLNISTIIIVTEKRTQPGRVTYCDINRSNIGHVQNKRVYGKQAYLKVSVAQVELVAQ